MNPESDKYDFETSQNKISEDLCMSASGNMLNFRFAIKIQNFQKLNLLAFK